MEAMKRFRRSRGGQEETMALAVAFAMGGLALALAITAGYAPSIGSVVSVVSPLLVIATVALLVVYVHRLPGLIVAGALGGGLVGFFALGVGSRTAMRVIALLGGSREVSVEGTMALLVGGTVGGAVIGAVVSAALRAWPRHARLIGVVTGIILFASREILLPRVSAETTSSLQPECHRTVRGHWRASLPEGRQESGRGCPPADPRASSSNDRDPPR